MEIKTMKTNKTLLLTLALTAACCAQQARGMMIPSFVTKMLVMPDNQQELTELFNKNLMTYNNICNKCFLHALNKQYYSLAEQFYHRLQKDACTEDRFPYSPLQLLEDIKNDPNLCTTTQQGDITTWNIDFNFLIMLLKNGIELLDSQSLQYKEYHPLSHRLEPFIDMDTSNMSGEISSQPIHANFDNVSLLKAYLEKTVTKNNSTQLMYLLSKYHYYMYLFSNILKQEIRSPEDVQKDIEEYLQWSFLNDRERERLLNDSLYERPQPEDTELFIQNRIETLTHAFKQLDSKNKYYLLTCIELYNHMLIRDALHFPQLKELYRKPGYNAYFKYQ